MRHARGWVNWAVASALLLLLQACAGVPRDASLPINDPNEQLNRRVMAASQAMLRPASRVVNAIPDPVQDRLRDFSSNLKEPRIFVNNVLQGRFKAAHTTAGRFLGNSIFGLGGLFDIASREGVQQNSGDFGQTLFVWGVAEGPYVVHLAPSTLRDAVGSAVDMVADPVGWATGSQVALSVSTSVLDAAANLGQLKQAEDASIDFYSFIRSSYYQTRRAELREAIGLPSVIDSPALDDPDDPEPGSGANAQSPTRDDEMKRRAQVTIVADERQDER
jgi:phospholipid-binding lipoprotein MlaA